ncbi:GPP34 family phosphoprotein [Smaragdicoccus niigatensis]|uniref:GPP34 family phosphoprotein n=1 Tax=Smaragdicoccus niigatensis TaxID=359359 RepID=UPI00037B345A|nr:GPP34 family phosphoprotein [Smaragdicoccus niigatensis]
MGERHIADDVVLLSIVARRKGAVRPSDFHVALGNALMSELELDGLVTIEKRGGLGARGYTVSSDASSVRRPQAQALSDLRGQPVQQFEVVKFASRWTLEVLTDLEAAGLLVRRDRCMRQQEWKLANFDRVESARARVTRLLVDGAPPELDDAVMLTHLALITRLERVVLRPPRSAAYPLVCVDPKCRCRKIPIHRVRDFVEHARDRHRHDLPFAARNFPDHSLKPADFLPQNWNLSC